MTYEGRFTGGGILLDIWRECTTRISKSWPLLRSFAYPFEFHLRCLPHARTFIFTDRLFHVSSESSFMTVRQHLLLISCLILGFVSGILRFRLWLAVCLMTLSSGFRAGGSEPCV